MKKFIAMILFFASFSAFAALSPQDVVKEVHQGHWQKADQMLSEIVQQHPNSAKAWYYKSQVDLHLQNAQLASQELSKAVNIEPNMHFASSQSEVSQLQKQIQFQLQNRTSSVTHSSPQQNSHSHFLAWLGGFIIILAIGITIFVIWSNRKKNAEMEQQRLQYLSQLVDAQSNLMQLQKDIHYSGKEKTQLALDLEKVLDSTNDEIKYIRQSSQWDNHISSYENIFSSVKILQANFKQEKFDTSLEESQESQESKQNNNVLYPNEISQQGSLGVISSGYQPQQTVVVQNSNNGFFNGLLMGELISGSNRPQENIVVNNIDNNSSSSDNWNNSSQNDFDTSSNNDSSWSDSNNDSSSFDSGSSDDSWDDSSSDDSSSFDSGSSDDSSSW